MVWIGAISGIDWAIRRGGLPSPINPIEQILLVLPVRHRGNLGLESMFVSFATQKWTITKSLSKARPLRLLSLTVETVLVSILAKAYWI